MEDFPKRKELASLKQLFVLHGESSIFLHALPLNAGKLQNSLLELFFIFSLFDVTFHLSLVSC